MFDTDLDGAAGGQGGLTNMAQLQSVCDPTCASAYVGVSELLILIIDRTRERK